MTAPAPRSQPITIDGRTIRARNFASQIMAIIGDCVLDKDGAASSLIDAAYQADAQITPATLTARIEALEKALLDLQNDRRISLGSTHRKRIAALLATEMAWPCGCHDPDSCARHSACMYIQCINFGENIADEIARAVLQPKGAAV